MTLSRLTRRTVAAVAAFSLAFSAFAVSLPKGAQLRIHNAEGALVGAGRVDDDRELELDILPDQAGFATLTVRLPDGAEETYEVLYGERGQVLVVVGQEIVALRELANRAGLEYDIDVKDRNDRLGDDDCDDDDDRWDDDLDDCDDDDDLDDDDDRDDRRDGDRRHDGDRRSGDDRKNHGDDDGDWDDDDDGDDDRWDDDDDDDDRWDDDDDDDDDDRDD